MTKGIPSKATKILLLNLLFEEGEEEEDGGQPEWKAVMKQK